MLRVKDSFRVVIALALVSLSGSATFAQRVAQGPAAKTSVTLVSTQVTAFNFQGRLNDGANPANGSYDLQFALFDASAGGNQIGSTLSRPNTTIINGLFSTQLDFGVAAFTGADRFIEISVRPANSANQFVILGPRQQILAVPYAVRSLRATLADDATHAVNADDAVNASFADYATNAGDAVNASLATYATNAQTAVNAQQLGGVAASQYVQQSSIGAVKAMANIIDTGNSDGSVSITQCYNSTLTGSAATAPPCGFSVNHFTAGGYGVDFGFNISGRFPLVSIGALNGFGSDTNAGVRLEQGGNSSTINVRTFRTGDTRTTSDVGSFTIILF